ncbi:hypothetical protein DFA_09300 [Cavenderia fasciculata]|uniref:Uncharacterized protein n=1 Tax=Cavenderia fasciculata TaxID=261658 RepID=F4Q788_CACFS|nr:uncharacterized protein DFA_09300 [Cavenderia fasciculata]EGG16270.1 hypothetical protein DFA_09300 [Cavenderia fasciculata]|eukprot:XP_004354654.1 hypothetical protein DFA_09300 [Cavenderia fasciculata]
MADVSNAELDNKPNKTCSFYFLVAKLKRMENQNPGEWQKSMNRLMVARNSGFVPDTAEFEARRKEILDKATKTNLPQTTQEGKYTTPSQSANRSFSNLFFYALLQPIINAHPIYNVFKEFAEIFDREYAKRKREEVLVYEKINDVQLELQALDLSHEQQT